MRIFVSVVNAWFVLFGLVAVAWPAFAQDPAGGRARATAPPPSSPGRLSVVVSGLRGDGAPRGQVVVALFDAATAAKTFPDTPARATQIIALDKLAPQTQTPSAPAAVAAVPTALPPPVSVTFADLAPGAYAVSLFHDENKNNKLDTGPFGIPREGYGFSRDPRPRFRAPRFDEAKFDLPAGGTAITVRVKY